MYTVYAGSDLIGHTALETGDAPMGVEFGLFIPSEGYPRVRSVCRQNHDDGHWYRPPCSNGRVFCTYACGLECNSRIRVK